MCAMSEMLDGDSQEENPPEKSTQNKNFVWTSLSE